MQRKPSTTSPAAKAFKKTKKDSVSAWKKKAWAVFSKWVRERDKYTCYTCGKNYSADGANKGYMHAGHFISRSHNNTLFCEINVRAQCYYCNVRERGNVGEFAYRLRQEIGDYAFADLLERGRKTKQFTVDELKSIIQKYTLKP